MSIVKVREFRPNDVKEVARLQAQYSEWFEEGTVSESFILDSARRLDFRFFVAELDERVVGFSGVLFFAGVGRAEFGPVCVDKSFLERGIGARLVEGTLDFLRGKGVHRVVSRVKEANTAALDFFNAQGFAEEARLANYTKNGETVVQLVRFL